MMTTRGSASSSTALRRGSTARRLLWLALIALGLLLAYKAARVGVYGWGAYRSATALTALADSGSRLDALPRARGEMSKLAAALAGLDAELQPLAPALVPLRSLPVVGPLLAEVPQLTTAGSKLAALGSELTTLLAPTVAAPGGAPAKELVATLGRNGDRFAAFAVEADKAAETLAKVDPAELPARLAVPLQEAQSLAPLMAEGLRLAPVLPKLLGYEGAQTYLVLVQNNHELRATGGFISAVGRLTLENGQIGGLDFVDSYQINRQPSSYPRAPEPMMRFMNIPLMLLRDANWSPDLPTTAKLVRSLYAQESGIQIDGVITIDLHTAELLLSALGSLRVPGSDQPVTGDNVVDVVKQFWQTPLGEESVTVDEDLGRWWGSRKDFMPLLAGAVVERLQKGSVDLTALLQAGQQALAERSIQVWVADPTAAAVLAEAGWDGSLQPMPGQDFLALVDTNMGYNKVDSVLERSLDHRVSWPDGPQAPALAETTVTYRHTLPVPDHVCDQTPRYGETYDDLAKRCYFDYVRLYVPAGSRLLNITGVEFDSAVSQAADRNTQLFGGFFVLPPGEEHTVTFEYALPAGITPESYALVLQRQSGTEPLPLTVRAGDRTLATTLTEGKLEWAAKD